MRKTVFFLWIGVSFVAGTPVGPAHAQSGSAQALFAKYDLLGTFALDCKKPVGNGNIFWVHRALDGNVQRDQMSGPTTRDFVVLWQRAEELRPNEIALSGIRDGQPIEAVFRAEAERMRIMEATFKGNKLTSGGRFANGQESPWTPKCAGP